MIYAELVDVGVMLVTLDAVGGVGRRRFGALTVDYDAKTAHLDGEQLPLTPSEFALLAALTLAPRKAVRSRDLLSAMWGDEWHADTTPLQVHVSRLRAKLGESGAAPSRIVSVRGFGYRFEPGPEAMAERTVELLIDADLILRDVTPSDPFLGYTPTELIGTFFSPLGLNEAQLRLVVDSMIGNGTTSVDGPSFVQTASGEHRMVRVATDILLSGKGTFDGLRSTFYLPDDPPRLDRASLAVEDALHDLPGPSADP